MIFFYFLLIACGILLYGVVGADKTFLLSAMLLGGYGLSVVTFWNARRSNGWVISLNDGCWLLFGGWGIYIVGHAAAPFDATIAILILGAVLGLYWSIIQLAGSFRLSRFLLGGFIVLLMVAALYGVTNFLKHPESILWAERYTDHYTRGEPRLASTYICPNHFAHLLLLLLPFCGAFVFIPQAGLYLRILAGYSFFAYLSALYFTESRAGWLGSMVAVGVTLLLMALRKSKLLFGLLVVLVPLSGILILVGAWNYSEPFQRRMTPVLQFAEQFKKHGLEAEFTDFRPKTWADTLAMIEDVPTEGFGPDSYEYVFPQYRERMKAARALTGHPHNEYLELIADYGWMGFGLFAVAWCWGLLRILIFSLKTPNRHHAWVAMAFLGAAAGTMVHSFFDFEMHILPNAMLFAVLAGVTMGLMKGNGGAGRSQDRNVKSQDDRSQREETGNAGASKSNSIHDLLRGVICWGLVVVFLLGLGASVKVMGSAVWCTLGDRALEDQDEPRAEARYIHAIAWDARNWKAYKEIAKMRFQERYYLLDLDQKYAAALDEQTWFERALKHNPHDAESMMGLGKAKLFNARNPLLRSVAGSLNEQGLELMARSCQYQKFNESYWWNYGVALRKQGHLAEALEAFEQAKRVKSSLTIRKNIEWIKRRMKEGSSSEEPISAAASAAEVKEVLDLFDQF